MVKLRQFQISDEIFNGFIYELDVEIAKDKEDICRRVVNQIRQIFTFFKFDELVKLLESKSFHIHSITFEEIKSGNEQNIFYICGHCNDSELN